MVFIGWNIKEHKLYTTHQSLNSTRRQYMVWAERRSFHLVLSHWSKTAKGPDKCNLISCPRGKTPNSSVWPCDQCTHKSKEEKKRFKKRSFGLLRFSWVLKNDCSDVIKEKSGSIVCSISQSFSTSFQKELNTQTVKQYGETDFNTINRLVFIQRVLTDCVVERTLRSPSRP